MKVSIKFSLASGKASDLPIRIRVSYDGLRLDLRTGYVCPPDAWDPTTMRMLPGTKNRYGEKASVVNAKLSKQETDLNTILTKYELDGNVPEISVLKADFEFFQGRGPKKKPSELSVSEIFDKFLLDNSKHFQASSMRNYYIVQHKFANNPIGSKMISLLTSEDLDEFVDSLIDEELQNRTIQVYVRIMKTCLRWAYKKELYSGRLFDQYEVDLRQVRKDVMYLEWSEFLAIYNLNLFKPHHVYARDMFCFCCVTGLRFSDCYNLTWDDVHLDAQKPCIHLIAQKTKKQTIIELNKFSSDILSRQARDRVHVFPRYNLRTRRDVLHFIARSAGLNRKVRRLSMIGSKMDVCYKHVWEVISSHWGRHTFIVHALSLGIPPSVIMSWTGHSTFNAMKPYVDIASKEKTENMSKFDE